MRWVYFPPILHVCVCIASNLGYLIPSLQYFSGRLNGYIILADLPISIMVFALAWQYPVLAMTWLVVIGTLWWYLLSRLLELGVQKFLRKNDQFPSLKL